jgi:hypothetical protein
MVSITEPIKTEPTKKNSLLRPRLTHVEISIVNNCLRFFLERFNGAKLDNETKRSLEYVRRLQKRFEKLEQGKGFLRPRR